MFTYIFADCPSCARERLGCDFQKKKERKGIGAKILGIRGRAPALGRLTHPRSREILC